MTDLEALVVAAYVFADECPVLSARGVGGTVTGITDGRPRCGHAFVAISAGVMVAAPAEGVKMLVCPSSHRTRTRVGSSPRISSTTPARPGCAARRGGSGRADRERAARRIKQADVAGTGVARPARTGTATECSHTAHPRARGKSGTVDAGTALDVYLLRPVADRDDERALVHSYLQTWGRMSDVRAVLLE